MIGSVSLMFAAAGRAYYIPAGVFSRVFQRPKKEPI